RAETGAAGCAPKRVHRAQGEADDGRDQEDRYARRSRAQPTATGGYAADCLDSPRRTPGPAVASPCAQAQRFHSINGIRAPLDGELPRDSTMTRDGPGPAR